MDPTAIVVVGVIALAVAAFIAWPLLGTRGVRSGARGVASHGGDATGVDVDRIERRIIEYREALRRRTLCARCLYANPAASRFCAQCGERLASADAPLGAEVSTR